VTGVIWTRARGSVVGAGLVGGSADILDFLLPLWAGEQLGAAPGQIGALVALELACSVVARPVAGRLVDTRERTRVAASGAVLFAVACLGYALAPGLGAAFAAAATGGVGGALLWIGVRAITAERLDEDSGAFAGLFSAVAFASWFFWVPAVVLLPVLGYRGVFAALGLTCGLGAVALLRAPRSLRDAGGAVPPDRRVARTLAPLLGVVVLTALAESGIGLLLLLHLQHAGLEVYQIALVQAPGGVALTLLPRPLHRLTARHGRRAVYAVSALGSAVCAAALASDPAPPVVAALWVLAGVAWAASTPIHEAAVAQVSVGRTGRGMSLLGNASLVGAALGSGAAGALYGVASWPVACAVFAGAIGLGALAGPAALARMQIADRPDVGDPARTAERDGLPANAPGPVPADDRDRS